MPLDISGFVTPEQKFEGLYKLGDAIQKQKAAEAKAKTEAKKAEDKSKTELQKSLAFLQDPTKYLTSTPMDPGVLQKFTDAAKAGYEFIQNNPSGQRYQLDAVMQPYMNEIVQSYNIGKTYNDLLDKSMTTVPEGYDKEKIRNLARKNFFLNENGELKKSDDLRSSMQSGYDPIRNVIEMNPEEVAIGKEDDWLKSQKTTKQSYATESGARGGGGGTVTKKEVSIEHPWWATPKTNEKGDLVLDKNGIGSFVPKSEIATDGDETIKTADGQPVRLVTKEVFDNYTTDPSTRDKIRGEIKAHLKDYVDSTGKPIDINNPTNAKKVENLARAIVYNRLAAQPIGEFSTKKSAVTSTIAPRSSGGGSGKGEGETVVFDIYKQLDDVAKAGGYNVLNYNQKPVGMILNQLPPKLQEGLVNLANNSTGKKDYDATKLVVKVNGPGQYDLYSWDSETNTPALISPIDEASLNLSIDQAGKGEKQKVTKSQGGWRVGEIITKGVNKLKGALNKK